MPAADAGEAVRFCRHHGLEALLFHAMHELQEWPSWPLELRRSLEQAGKIGVAAELHRGHYLNAVMRGLSRAGIRFLLIKGEALAQTHYPVPGTRTRCDSDVFIPIEAIVAAKKAVTDAGFVIVSPVYKTHQFTARRTASEAEVFECDIHWRILNAPRFARSICFEEAYAGSVHLPKLEGVRTLSAVNSLLLACMHRVGSRWHDQERLIWIYDIHALVSSMSQADLLDFAASARTRNVQAACLSGLNRAARHFGTRVPEAVTALLQTPERNRFFRYSNLGLLADDWMKLPGNAARRAMLSELFLPPGNSLMRQYGKQARWWLPVLYVRHFLSGVARRLTLN